MDVNGVRFHMAQGEADWTAWLGETGAAGLVFDAPSDSLSLAPVVERLRGAAHEAPLTADDRRGADCDRYGNWHWIGEDRRSIRILPCAAHVAQPFWSVDDLAKRPCTPKGGGAPLFTPVSKPPASWPGLTLSGLAITERHYMIVGTLDPGGLLVFDLHGGGPPVFSVWPEEISFEPFDIAAAWGGGVWILDRGGQGLGGRYWRLDSWLRPAPGAGLIELKPAEPDQFEPAGGEPKTNAAVLFPAAFSVASASPAEAEAPRAIIGLPDGSVLILDSPAGAAYSRILRWSGGELAGEIALGPGLLGEGLEDPAAIAGHDMAFVPASGSHEGGLLPGAVRGRLFVADVGGNQAFGFDLEADGSRFGLTFRREQLPMRRFGGKALECCGGQAHYDLGERWMPLAVHPRSQYVEGAVIEGLVFDGKTPGCHWRRLIFDACIPNGAAVTVESRAADERRGLRQTLWQTEPELYRRAEGPEIPFHNPYAGSQLEAQGAGAWETLFQSARGRFIELRLTLTGGGRVTPRLRSMRVYYPAFSYLERYLPAAYREDLVSASFLDRYLANAEGLFTSLEGRIAAAEGLFDPRTAPDGYLDWLTGWLGVTLDPDWDGPRRRLFLTYAELLFRWRGTPAGLLAMIRLAIEPCPSAEIFADLLAGRLPREDRHAGHSVRLVESFLARSFPGVSLGDPSVPQAPGIAPASEWTPSQGAEPLHERFRGFLAAKYAPGEPPANALPAVSAAWEQSPVFASLGQIRLSPVLPSHPTKAADWREFLGAGLGFHYAAVSAGDAAFYREFLERRWGRVDALNAAYQLAGGSAWTSFASVALPAEDDFPSGGQRLHDWISFASLAVPIRNSAHRFTVLIPAAPSETAAERARRADVVQAIVAREKPAHTDFEVRPFWALFQVGSARLGLDTALGEGARFTAIELGRTALSEGFLAYGHPWNVTDRAVAGRDAVPEIRP